MNRPQFHPTLMVTIEIEFSLAHFTCSTAIAENDTDQEAKGFAKTVLTPIDLQGPAILPLPAQLRSAI